MPVMTDQDRKTLVGKLVLERRRLEIECQTAKQQLLHLSSAFQTLGTRIQEQAEEGLNHHLLAVALADDSLKTWDLSRVEQLMEEYRQLQGKLRDIQSDLQGMGAL